ncbi:MAG TPA: hypothetical protein VFO41_07185 [Alphaproteobacteria bacterium]|nr:hypothetical protein [Alphaproteobacteria bacterium]
MGADEELPGIDAAYSACLDRIFEDFLAKRAERSGRHDREVRAPEIALGIARAHGLLPSPGSTLAVTGSKGKGTVARLAAAYLAAQPGLGRIGLFVSPQEIDQVDRIRIDGRPIPRADFIRLYDRFEPDLDRARATLTGGRYLSPFGTFLLIALAWFRENGVAWTVLESGRGAAYDEVGRLPVGVAAVTSIFLEHAGQIGPGLRDIALNKLAIAKGAAATVLGPGVSGLISRLDLPLPAGARVVAERHHGPALPGWCEIDLDIAVTAVDALLELNGIAPATVDVPVVTASFGQAGFEGCPLVYDATIAFPAFDRPYFEALRATHGRVLVPLSLSDQKDAAPFISYFAAQGVDLAPIVLSGLDLHTYRRMEADPLHTPVGAVAFTDASALAQVLRQVVAEHRPGLIYALGIQPFIRLLKQAAGIRFI